MLDAEAVLFVDDHEPEPFELELGLEQLVRADHDVDRAVREPLERAGRARRAPEARQELDPHRPLREPILERAMVLLREQRRRHEHGDLEAGLHGHERGAQRDLGLAEAHVAADDAVHRFRAREVLEHALDRRELILGLLERKLEREALIAVVLERHRGADARRAPRVEIQELGGRVARRFRGFTFRLRPLVRAEPVQRRILGRGTAVARDEMQALHGHVELVAARVLEQQELGQHAVHVERREAAIAADAVVLVHDRRADQEIGELADHGFGIARAPPAVGAASAAPCRARSR